MSVMRQDPATKEWVIIAPNRGRRPHDAVAPPERRGEARVETCPFCPGNERLTPEEVLRIPSPGGDGWQVRVCPNKFPALAHDGPIERHEDGPLFRELTGVGHHEVIVETPRHDRTMAFMTDDELLAVLQAFRARHLALRDEGRARYILIFKNHGVNAGTSLDHPHSQLIATPVAPLHVRQRYDIAIAHYDDTGRCLYCDILDAERADGTRMVLDGDGFAVFEPFASRGPFETWIMPERRQASFGQLQDDELRALASALRTTLRALHDALGNPDFNLIIQSAPFEDEHKPYFLWHIQILPRLTTLAGFELGSGMRITTVAPEECADVLRASLPSAR